MIAFHHRSTKVIITFLFCAYGTQALIPGNGGGGTQRRQMLQQMATVLTSWTGSTKKVNGITATTTTTTRTPHPPRPKSYGTLFQTTNQKAMLATPQSLLQLVQNEILGTAGSDTRGILCIGERHDCFEHHLAQLRTIMAMKRGIISAARTKTGSEGDNAMKQSTTPPQLAIGLECFQRQHQPHLDRYIYEKNTSSSSSSPYNIKKLMKDVKWDTSWGYDVLHYTPILEYARKSQIRIVGLDAPTHLIRSVDQYGIESMQVKSTMGPFSLPRGGVDGKLGGYERNARLVLGDYGVEDRTSLSSLSDYCLTVNQKRMKEVQDLRDEYMAESVSLHLNQNDGWIVVLAGTRHVERRDGLPIRALKRVALDVERKAFLAEERVNRGVFTILPTSLVPGSPVRLPTIEDCDLAWFVPPSDDFDPNHVNSAPRFNELIS